MFLGKSTKFVLEFCGLDPLGTLALVDIATLSCFNHEFLRIFAQAPLSFCHNDFFVKKELSVIFIRKKIFGTKPHTST
jgi:hypothetical protein